MDSIWELPSRPDFPALDGDISTDVLIIGGGMAGILCAALLTEAGVSCVVAEANRIGSGVTGRTTAKLTVQHGLIYHQIARRYGMEAAGQYLRANQAALEKFRGLCQGLDCDFEARDSFVYSRTDLNVLEKELDILGKLGVKSEFAFPLPLPVSTVGGVKIPNQAQFHPLKFLYAVARPLSVYENTRVLELKGCEAQTAHGTIHAKRIIIATHFPFLNKHGLYFLKLYQHRSYCLALENAPGPEGMYVDEALTGLSFRRQGELLLLGGGSHRTGKPGGGWRELEEFARTAYPNAAIRARWATQDCMGLDKIPYIGPYSRFTKDLYVATGFHKWGMTGSMAAAQILTGLLTGQAPEYASLFSPSRTMLHGQLAINAWEAGTSLLLPARRRCPHLGCGLKWNRQEHSWDCPCHGSRFDENGKLLNGPATGDLP